MIKKLLAPVVVELRSWATYHLLMLAVCTVPKGDSRVRLAKLVCAYLECEVLAIKQQMRQRAV